MELSKFCNAHLPVASLVEVLAFKTYVLSYSAHLLVNFKNHVQNE